MDEIIDYKRVLNMYKNECITLYISLWNKKRIQTKQQAFKKTALTKVKVWLFVENYINFNDICYFYNLC